MSDALERLGARTFPIIFAAPSGAGKTSIARALAERRTDLQFSISATTRLPRHYERDGQDYYFVTEAEFERMVEAGELLEWARVHGNLYGTPRRNLDEAVAARRFLILDIDVEGSRQVRRLVPEAVSIFVLPPSGRVLADRLAGRGSEDPAVQRRRLEAARQEIAAVSEFDYVIVNVSLDASVDAVESIIGAEAHRTLRFPALQQAVELLGQEVDRYLSARERAPGS